VHSELDDGKSAFGERRGAELDVTWVKNNSAAVPMCFKPSSFASWLSPYPQGTTQAKATSK
jgi:hypothetical protein